MRPLLTSRLRNGIRKGQSCNVERAIRDGVNHGNAVALVQKYEEGKQP